MARRSSGWLYVGGSNGRLEADRRGGGTGAGDDAFVEEVTARREMSSVGRKGASSRAFFLHSAPFDR